MGKYLTWRKLLPRGKQSLTRTRPSFSSTGRRTWWSPGSVSTVLGWPQVFHPLAQQGCSDPQACLLPWQWVFFCREETNQMRASRRTCCPGRPGAGVLPQRAGATAVLGTGLPHGFAKKKKKCSWPVKEAVEVTIGTKWAQQLAPGCIGAAVSQLRGSRVRSAFRREGTRL